MGVNLDEYRQRRSILQRHQNAAVKMLSRTILTQCAKTFGMLKGNNLMLQSESEMAILMDYCIYSHRQKGKTVVERYLAKLPPTQDPEEQVVREAMALSQYSMYRAGKGIPGTGLQVHDMVRDESLFLADQTLSRTFEEGRVLGARLLPLPDYWMTTGAGVPLGEETVTEIAMVFVTALLLTEGSLKRLSPKAETELATVIIGAAMEEGGTTRIKYQ